MLAIAASGQISAQELEPGAYSPAPVGFNILVAGVTYNSGDLAFDPSGPISDASADISVGVVGYVRTIGLWGRSASLAFAQPYVRGNLEGVYRGEQQDVYRSGLGDPRFRFAINLHGAPAMSVQEFVSYQPKTNLGVSLVVAPPLGQYDSSKLINIGGNRWSFKPELGVTRTLGRWTLEAYAGAWLFTSNTDFAGGQTRSQEPIGSFQGHVIYTFRPRMWMALDLNYYTGGRTTVDDTENADLQHNSRVGLTFSLPVSRQHSLKFTYSRGALTSIGADFESIGVAWQYVWH